MITRIIGNHRFKRRDVFTTKAEAKKYIENARSYGEQVRTIKTAKGYEIWARVGDYQIRKKKKKKKKIHNLYSFITINY